MNTKTFISGPLRGIVLTLVMAFLLTAPACAANESPSGQTTSARTAADSASLTVSPAGEYLDVPESAWYSGAVGYLYEHGIMNGTGDGRFSPEDTFTRAQLAAVLYRLAGEPAVTGQDSFSDTEPGAWYSDAVLWAEQSGVVNGVGGGRYAPSDPVTQEQLVTMLYRMQGEPGTTPVSDASPYAANAVGWARANGIAPAAEDYTFVPKENACRAQVAALLYGYLMQLNGRQEIVLTVAGQRLSVDWAENSSVDALRELLKKGDITLDMSDYGGFEKGAPLPETLPQNNEQMNADAGDVILYQGRQFVIYYDKNSWSLTPLGKITGMTKTELRSLLGAGNAAATLSLGKAAGASESRTLVAYFSATGNTRPLAEYAAELLSADLYEIVPEVPYTPDDLKYYTDCRADREQNDPGARPAIGGELPDMSRYDTVVIGHPIWHGQAPKIIYTFLESFDSSGKQLVTFCTSHSSGLGSSAENLKKLTPGASWLESRRFAAGTGKDAIRAWLEETGLYRESAGMMLDMNAKTVLFNGSCAMPVTGLGVRTLSDGGAGDSVHHALKSGMRLIDTVRYQDTATHSKG